MAGEKGNKWENGGLRSLASTAFQRHNRQEKALQTLICKASWLETIELIQCDHGHTFSANVTNVLLGHIGLALVTPAWFGHKAAFLKSP